MYSKAIAGTTFNNGGKFEAVAYGQTPPDNIGAWGLVSDGAESANSINRGVHGECSAPSSHTGTYYGVSGWVNNESTNDYAGYFQGKVYASAGYTSSDSILKNNINDLVNGLAVINQLQPKTYSFKTGSFPELNLQSGLHAGLIAQSVDSILPELVGSAKQPEVIDALGNVIKSGFTFKVLNYTELIPYLIAAIKEQQVQIDALSNQLKQSTGNNNSQQLYNKNFVTLDDVNSIIVRSKRSQPIYGPNHY